MSFNSFFISLFALISSFHAFAEPISPRIVGGEASVPESWQSFVALSYKDDPDDAFCGAVLIEPSWVMTAAHCVDDKVPSEVQAVIGLYTYSGQSERTAKEYFDIVQVVIHPLFSGSVGEEGDVALVQLDGVSTEKVSKLYAGSSSLEGNLGTLVGFGDTVVQDELFSNTSDYPARRQQVSLPVINNALCATAMQTAAQVYDSQICVGVPEGGKDGCAGDSGGPLYLNQGSETVVGVVSYGVGCALPGYYAVNTRVSHYIDFIQQYVPNVQLDVENYGYTITREVSGAWYNPERNGEGWIVEVLPNNLIVVDWFTYDFTGKSIYLFGSGYYQPNEDQVTVELYQTLGAKFGDEFDANEIIRTKWGMMTFSVQSCNQAHVTYNSFLSVYGQGQHDLTRLTKLNTSNCAGRYDGSERSLAGSWFAPARNGEGLILETLQDNKLGFFFFTYDFTGHQLTLTGVADKQLDGTYSGVVHAPSGPKFGRQYDKSALIAPELGTLTITPQDCNQLLFSYDFLRGYGSKTHQYTRLTGVVGNGCE